MSSPVAFFCNRDARPNVELLFLNPDGGATLVETPTLYADAAAYFEYRPLGTRYFMFTYYDNSRTIPNDDIQFFGIWDSRNAEWVDNDWIWTTTNNGWGTNYDTFYMDNVTANKTYYWYAGLGESGNSIQNFYPRYTRARTLDGNNGSVYNDYHMSGITLLQISTNEAAILTSEGVIEFGLTQGVWGDTVRLNKDCILNVWADSSNDDKYVIDLYQYSINENTLVHSILTDNIDMNSIRIVNDRIYVEIQGSPTKIYALSGDSYELYEFSEDGMSESDNDCR
jgi:hypothetical protein